MDYDLYDDEQLVNGILNNDRPLIEYFFQRKCSKLFSYILLSVADGNIDKRELVSELIWLGVTSFALVNDGYIYIDKGGRPIYMTSQIPKLMLKHDAKALYVKTMKDSVLVLYQDGILKTTQSMDEISNVCFGEFRNS